MVREACREVVPTDEAVRRFGADVSSRHDPIRYSDCRYYVHCGEHLRHAERVG